MRSAAKARVSSMPRAVPLWPCAQNNGIISLTNVASRQAGWACAGWLILLGVLGKVTHDD